MLFLSKMFLVTITLLTLPTSVHSMEYVHKISDTVRGWFTWPHQEYTTEHGIAPETIIDITNQTGNITITSWNKPRVMVHALKHASTEAMLTKTTIITKSTTEDDKAVLKITTQQPDPKSSIDFDLVVPKDSPIRIVTEQTGNIKIKDNAANIVVSTQQGTIKLIQTPGPIHAQTDHGDITVKLKKFLDSSSLFLKTNSGNITLKAPADLNALLNAKTGNGSIKADIPITLEPVTVTLTKEARKQFFKQVNGTFGSGLTPVTIEVGSGNIAIEKY